MYYRGAGIGQNKQKPYLAIPKRQNKVTRKYYTFQQVCMNKAVQQDDSLVKQYVKQA